MATESSVLVNLKDLFEMEADRRAEEAVAKERTKAEAAAREDAERRARDVAIERAREEERRRAEEERARRDRELEERLRVLRDELGEVRAQREEMRLKVAEIAALPEPSSRRGSWIAGVMAAASLVAAITAIAVAWPKHEPAIAQVARTATERSSEPAVEAAAPDTAEPEAVAPEPAPVIATATPERPVRRGQHPRVRRETSEDRLTHELDFGGGDEVLSDDFLNGAGH